LASTSHHGGGPRVAVVIPCYNGDAYVLDAVASLADEEPHELVVVDDGSDAEVTLDALEMLRADGVRVIRQENAGVSAARMAGVESTSAPYVLALDADDQVFPGSVAALADHLDDHPEDVVCWGHTIEFGAHDAEHLRGLALDPWLITFMNFAPAMTLTRREALLEVGGWGPAGYEDWDLLLSFAERGWSGHSIRRHVQRYRIHETDSLLSTHRRSHGAAMAALRDRHSGLFARRRSSCRVSTAPAAVRGLLPLVAAAPISEPARYRLTERIVNWFSPAHRWRRLDEPRRHPVVNAAARRLSALRRN
jgi:glycosyltransferase involved in cell wall biosynthesis